MSQLEVHVNYDAIAHNVQVLRSRTGTAELMAVVKADAYGHGLVPAGAAARRGGAAWLGVAQPHEALALRAAGDTGRILTWLYGPDFPARALMAADVDVSVSSLNVLETVIAQASETQLAARIHLCVDTGLAREGVTPEQLPAFLERAREAQAQGHVVIVGMWSHLAWADAPGHPTIDAQADVFRNALELAQSQGIELELRHLANSACTLTRPDLHFDLVRPGIAIYGLPPVPDPDGANFGLMPAMTVRSEVILVKDVPAGQGVSYGHDYTTTEPTTLALVSAGYADGVFRSASNLAPVGIGGQTYRIAGRVCMDQFVVDLGPGSTVRAGDTVTLFGEGGPSATDWADSIDTIDYEVVCRFGVLRDKTPVEGAP